MWQLLYVFGYDGVYVPKPGKSSWPLGTGFKAKSNPSVPI